MPKDKEARSGSSNEASFTNASPEAKVKGGSTPLLSTMIYKEKICSVCGKEMDDYGHNAEPVNKGRCCRYCNFSIVLPARLDYLNKKTEQHGS